MYSIYQDHSIDSRFCKKVSWFPPDTVAKMLDVLNDFDSRIVIDSEFLYDLKLAKLLANNIIKGNTSVRKKFNLLYCRLVDAYNRAATKYNKSV